MPRKARRTKRPPFQAQFDQARELPVARRPRGLGKVHPNSMAARKWGRTSWGFRGE